MNLHGRFVLELKNGEIFFAFYSDFRHNSVVREHGMNR